MSGRNSRELNFDPVSRKIVEVSASARSKNRLGKYARIIMMYRNYIIVAGAILAAFLIGFFVRDVISSIRQIIPSSCTYEGRTYRHGESFPAQDRCNSCSCESGKIACTLMACEVTDGPPEDNPLLYPRNSGEVVCTMDAKVCPDGTSVGRISPFCEFAPCPGIYN